MKWMKGKEKKRKEATNILWICLYILRDFSFSFSSIHFGYEWFWFGIQKRSDTRITLLTISVTLFTSLQFHYIYIRNLKELWNSFSWNFIFHISFIEDDDVVVEFEVYSFFKWFPRIEKRIPFFSPHEQNTTCIYRKIWVIYLQWKQLFLMHSTRIFPCNFALWGTDWTEWTILF